MGPDGLTNAPPLSEEGVVPRPTWIGLDLLAAAADFGGVRPRGRSDRRHKVHDSRTAYVTARIPPRLTTLAQDGALGS